MFIILVITKRGKLWLSDPIHRINDVREAAGPFFPLSQGTFSACSEHPLLSAGATAARLATKRELGAGSRSGASSVPTQADRKKISSQDSADPGLFRVHLELWVTFWALLFTGDPQRKGSRTRSPLETTGEAAEESGSWGAEGTLNSDGPSWRRMQGGTTGAGGQSEAHRQVTQKGRL